jgi:hypothetical protein
VALRTHVRLSHTLHRTNPKPDPQRGAGSDGKHRRQHHFTASPSLLRPSLPSAEHHRRTRWQEPAPPPQHPPTGLCSHLPLRPSVVVVDDVLNVDSKDMYPTDLLLMDPISLTLPAVAPSLPFVPSNRAAELRRSTSFAWVSAQ